MSRLERAAAPVALVSLTCWVAAAVVMSRRGLDLTDESFYLLSYRWWDSNPRTFTGAQYLYGPVFELMGYNVRGLRLLRLVALVAAHAALAESVARYLRAVGRPAWSHGLPVRLLLVSLGGISYGWLPQAPGYNDVALLVSLLVVAVLLAVAAHRTAGDPPPLLFLAGAGWCLGALALAKWSAALAVGVLFIVAAIALTWRSRRDLLSVLGATSAGVGLWIVTVQVTVGPWEAILTPIREVNALVTAETNSPLTLIALYLRTTGSLVILSLFLAVVAVLPAVLRYRRQPARNPALWALPLAAVLPWLITRELPGGGVGRAWSYSLSLTTLTLAAVLISLLRRRAVDGDHVSRDQTAPDHVILGVLVMAPAAQAFGTGNPLYLLAVGGFAFWGAAVVILSARDGCPEARTTSLTFLVTSSALVSLIATTGLLLHPYRSDDVQTATVEISAGNLEGLLLGGALSDDLLALKNLVDSAAPADSAVYAVDELAGAVLALDRPPAGEAWTSRLDNARSAAGLSSWCQDHPETSPPIILADRALSSLDREALRACGWPFYPSFRVLPWRDGPDDLRVYVPRAQ